VISVSKPPEFAMRHATLSRTVCLLAALVATTGCVHLQAKSGSSFEPGTRVRVSSGGVGLVGTVVALVRDTLTIRPVKDSDTVVVVVLSELTRLERSTGRHSHARMGMGIGLLLGATGGAIAGHARGDDKGSWWRYTALEKARIDAVDYGTAGALLGLIIGGNFPTEDWQLVPLSSGSRISVGPRSGARVALTYSVAF
jgi:hypothetical protein